MKVLITGAAGKVGRRVSQRFHEHDLVLIDTATTDDTAIHNVDIKSLGTLSEYMKGVDVIVHLAAIPDPVPFDEYETILDVNVVGTLNVLQAARKANVKRVVMASSICATGLIYWLTPWSPVYLPLDEQHPCWPDDNYGASKLMCETIARGFHVREGIEIAALRLCGVFFPDDANSIERYRGWLKDPSGELVNRLWSYVSVSDVVEAFFLAATVPNLSFEILDIAAADSAVGGSDLEFLVKKHYPSLIEDVRQLVKDRGGAPSLISTSRAYEALGWVARDSYLDHIDSLAH